MYTSSALHLNTPYSFFPARQRKSIRNQDVIVSPNTVQGQEAVSEPVRHQRQQRCTFRFLYERKNPRSLAAQTLQAVAHLLLLAAQVCYLLLILIVKSLHLLTRLLQVIVFPHQLRVFPLQGIHVLLQLGLVAQQPTVQRAVTAHKKILLEASLQGQSPGVIHVKHEFPTKEAGQTDSILHICVFRAPGKKQNQKQTGTEA